MSRPIVIGLSPNLEGKDLRLAWKLFLSPWQYQKGKYTQNLEQWFQKNFGATTAVGFISARSALYSLLKAANIQAGDEVLLQAFTCVAVPNAVVSLGGLPVYVDIDTSLTIDPADLEKKISKKAKAIIVQHTFGIPSDMKKIQKIAKEHNLIVIEDCAHTIGAEVDGKKLGTFGDGAVFSFGRDKAFSSVFGGVAIAKNPAIADKLKSIQFKLPQASTFWIAQQLFHPIATSVILPFYNVYIGKILLMILQKFRLLSFPVSAKEKKHALISMKRMPNALARLALFQLSRLYEFNSKRKKYVAMYNKAFAPDQLHDISNSLPLLRFPILVKDQKGVLAFFRKKGIVFGNWYAHVLDPKDVARENFFYNQASLTPKAEEIAKKIINLPTYPTLSEEDVRKIITLFKSYAASKRS